MKIRPIYRGPLVFVVLAAATVCASAQHAMLKARVELTRNGHTLTNASQAVVWLTPVGATAEPPRQKVSEIPQLVQKNKSFHPSLLVIPVGGKVEFPNHDPFFHNAFSLFEGKRFDLGLYESGTTRFVQFDKPGVSFIFCNIHAEMSAVVIALATPYYAISDSRGNLSISNVPPGRYELQVFHSSVAPDALRALNREITVAPGATSLGTFTLAESDLTLAHKNKYGRDYDRPEPDSPAYARP
ncbi:MAG: carboxypeptidase regulatory-like domain-containing protein [Candidatus Sulfotelmatobacter sp.]